MSNKLRTIAASTAGALALAITPAVVTTATAPAAQAAGYKCGANNSFLGWSGQAAYKNCVSHGEMVAVFKQSGNVEYVCVPAKKTYNFWFTKKVQRASGHC